MQILGLLGMYFDAVVVFVMKFSLSDWLWPYCGLTTSDKLSLKLPSKCSSKLSLKLSPKLTSKLSLKFVQN